MKLDCQEVSSSATLNATVAIVHAGEIVAEFDYGEIVINVSYDADFASVENTVYAGCDFNVITDAQGRGALDVVRCIDGREYI